MDVSALYVLLAAFIAGFSFLFLTRLFIGLVVGSMKLIVLAGIGWGLFQYALPGEANTYRNRTLATLETGLSFAKDYTGSIRELLANYDLEVKFHKSENNHNRKGDGETSSKAERVSLKRTSFLVD